MAIGQRGLRANPTPTLPHGGRESFRCPSAFRALNNHSARASAHRLCPEKRSRAAFLLPPPQFFPPGARVGSGHEEGAFSSVMFSWRLRRFCASRACWACASLCQRVAISSGCLLSGSFSRRESSNRRRTSSCRRLLCWAMFAAKCNVLCGKEKAASGAEAAV